MQMKVSLLNLPESVDVSKELIEEERPQIKEHHNPTKRATDEYTPGEAFHEKKEKNQKTNQGGSYRRKIKQKYKKPKTRGDKNYNKKKKRR
jgi:ATP-dependent RNA helicase RhlE